MTSGRWTATEAITMLAFGRPETTSAVIRRELRALYRRERAQFDCAPALKVLCHADKAWSSNYIRGHDALIDACRKGKIRCWGDKGGRDSELPVIIPESAWMIGIAIIQDALQPGPETAIEDFDRIRLKSRSLYRCLEFSPADVERLNGETGQLQSALLEQTQVVVRSPVEPSTAGGQQNSMPASAISAGEGDPNIRRRSGGLDYRSNDAPLVAEAIAGIHAQRYRNATDAARDLAKRAAGHSAEASKMKRLLSQIKAGLGSDGA